MSPSPDSICSKFADKGVKVTVKRLPHSNKVILIEGDRLAFEFLGKLFLAHARAEDCGCEISPRGAGSGAGNAFFSKTARLGLYLHRLPCVNGEP